MAMTSLDDELKIQTFMTMKEGWERKNWRQCADLMTEDGILHSVMLDPCKGRENIYERIRKTEKPNKSVTLHVRSIGVANGVLFVERNDEITLDGVSHFIPPSAFSNSQTGRFPLARVLRSRNLAHCHPGTSARLS